MRMRHFKGRNDRTSALPVRLCGLHYCFNPSRSQFPLLPSGTRINTLVPAVASWAGWGGGAKSDVYQHVLAASTKQTPDRLLKTLQLLGVT